MSQSRLQQQLKNTSISDTDTECWIWKGQISNSGRGRVKIRDSEDQSNKIVSAEYASYLAFIGKVPDQHLVRQHCGNRLCINPEHLELFKYSI